MLKVLSASKPVELTFPADVSGLVSETYRHARRIVEYGAGNSTLFAASMVGKTVFSVESDLAWAQRMQTQVEQMDAESSVTIHHVNIGPTGDWGRPHGAAYWPEFYKYPLAPWVESDIEPDVVLIDGRFRAACFVATVESIRSPVTVLFDDYANRPKYHFIEKISTPIARVGRMAIFRITPEDAGKLALNELLHSFFRVSYSDGTSRVPAE
ncbi:hypothetical protein [Nesterenkonia ebinurensis]|uniref:hypothetical protein n=1 Tax=Nesterenkonia ebinurensis TaxID=2608252 RepID=UPI00123CB955|nr:hypothetical protein [Nesterenkonia ebinurensis]